MRLWRLSPTCLDRVGLIACWQEALLAKAALTRKGGYYNHSQLIDFKATENPLDAINWYLYYLYKEAKSRGYSFNLDKIEDVTSFTKLRVTRGQLNYEEIHLKSKLAIRSPKELWRLDTHQKAHPLFVVEDGPIADWEKVISY